MGKLPAVTVCGAGSAGLAIAGDLAITGARTSLLELPAWKESIDPVKAQGGIEITGDTNSGRTGKARLRTATTDPEEALDGAQLIIVASPAFGHEAFVQAIAPFMTTGHVLLFSTGYWACLRVAPILRAAGVIDNVIVAEDNIMPYMSRHEGNRVHIYGRKRTLRLSAWPARDTDRAMETISTLYPQHVAASSIIETNFWSSNVSGHAPINLGNISFFFDRARQFRFAAEVTPCASRLIEAFDRERIAVAAELDTVVTRELETLRTDYGCEGDTVFDALVSSDLAQGWTSDLANRQVLREDLCYFHIPMEAIASVLDVPVPVTTAIIDLMSVFAEYDYRAHGLSLSALGMETCRNKSDILAYVKDGIPAAST